MPADELAEVIKFFFKIIDKEPGQSDNIKKPNKNIMSNMMKINLHDCSDILDGLIKMNELHLLTEIVEVTEKNNAVIIEEYKIIDRYLRASSEFYKYQLGNIIYRRYDEYNEYNPVYFFDVLIRLFFSDKNEMSNECLEYSWKLIYNQCMKEVDKYRTFYRNILFSDICTWAICQYSALYIKRDSESAPNQKEHLEQIYKLLLKVIENVSITPVCSKEKGDVLKIITEFFLLCEYRNTRVFQVEVLDPLLEAERTDPEEPYIAKDGIIIDKERLKEIIFEGNKEKSTMFDANYELLIKGMKRFNHDLMAKYSFDERHLKAIYREMFLEKEKFHKKTAYSIFKDYACMNNHNIDEEEIYFIRQKINAGLYRECGKWELFKIRTKIERALYDLSFKILSNLEEGKVRDNLIIQYKPIFEALNNII